MSVRFEPALQLTQVALSSQVAFIVANSLTQSIKSVSMHKQYNLRVLECRLALEVLCRSQGVPRAGVRHLAHLETVLGVTSE